MWFLHTFNIHAFKKNKKTKLSVFDAEFKKMLMTFLVNF